MITIVSLSFPLPLTGGIIGSPGVSGFIFAGIFEAEAGSSFGAAGFRRFRTRSRALVFRILGQRQLTHPFPARDEVGHAVALHAAAVALGRVELEPRMGQAAFDGHALARIQHQAVGDEILGRGGRTGEKLLVQRPLARLDAESRVGLRLGEERRFPRQQSVHDGADGPGWRQ